MDLIYKNECYKIMGACFEVYKQKGAGFLESVYQECLTLEFAERNIPFLQQQPLSLEYKGQRLQQFFKPDFLCYDKIVVELKAVSELSKEHRAQLHNYLKAARSELGLLVNFGHFPKIEWERIARQGRR